MKITRRNFGMMATVSAAGLVLPRVAQAKTVTKMAPAAPGKNMHPLLAKRDQKAILARIQGLMKRETGLARSLS